jgi:hypothetical protein
MQAGHSHLLPQGNVGLRNTKFKKTKSQSEKKLKAGASSRSKILKLSLHKFAGYIPTYLAIDPYMAPRSEL